MMKTAFLYDPRYLLHDTGSGHPEVPERLAAVYEGIVKAGLLPKLFQVKAFPAQVKWIETVHNMSDMNLSTEGFSWLMQRIVEMAERYSGGRLISILEGGYSLKRLPELAKNHVEILLNG